MHVVVLGAGVVGVTTAYYLADAGCTVTVIDRQPGVAAETSFANAGLISTGHAFAWASPRAPRLMLRALLGTDPGFRIRWRELPALGGWGLRFLRECTAAGAKRNSQVKYRIARHSQACLAQIHEATGIDYHQRANGLLYYFRDPAQFELGVRNMDLIREFGHEVEVLDTAACVECEPALNGISDDLAGGVFCPTDESGDCHVFTTALAEHCRESGVDFRMGTAITGLERQESRIARVITDQGSVQGDTYVLALGSYSPQLARQVGIRLPVVPVRGYSLTLPITDPDAGPVVGGVDEGRLVAFGRMGPSLRMTATADFAGYDNRHTPEDFIKMRALARELFPEGVGHDQPKYWACLRPMTPDGPPILGHSPLANLYLNTGQGHMGWTMSCGSSQVVADILLGRKPEIDLAGLTFDRYG